MGFSAAKAPVSHLQRVQPVARGPPTIEGQVPAPARIPARKATSAAAGRARATTCRPAGLRCCFPTDPMVSDPSGLKNGDGTSLAPHQINARATGYARLQLGGVLQWNMLSHPKTVVFRLAWPETPLSRNRLGVARASREEGGRTRGGGPLGRIWPAAMACPCFPG